MTAAGAGQVGVRNPEIQQMIADMNAYNTEAMKLPEVLLEGFHAETPEMQLALMKFQQVRVDADRAD